MPIGHWLDSCIIDGRDVPEKLGGFEWFYVLCFRFHAIVGIWISANDTSLCIISDHFSESSTLLKEVSAYEAGCTT